MPKSIKCILEEMPGERRERIQARADALDVQVTLQDLRKSLGLTQSELAGLLHVSQAAVSKQERRTDMQLSTLFQVIRAMGGELKITAAIPGKGEFELSQFKGEGN